MPKSSENSYNYTELAMALLPILCYPDPRLHKVAKPVEKVDERIRKQIEDMFETMYEANGIGLAATQVDFHERLIVIDVSQDRDQKLVLINPEILWASEEKQVGEEGCLSVPGIYVPWTKTVTRVRLRPKACWPSASSTRWTTSWARCSWNTSRP